MDRECFVCGKILTQDYPQEPHNPLESNWLGATDWDTHGNWCSREFDGTFEENGDTLHIVICDECLKKRKNRAIQFNWRDHSRKS